MEKVYLKDWDLFSERYNSRNYMSKDHKWLLKTSSDKVSLNLSDLQDEKRISEDALSLGVITPRIKDIVEVDGGGVGIIYQYIDNKKSLSRAISEDFGTLDKHMKTFATLGKHIHNIECDTNKFYCIEEKMYAYIEMTKLFNEKEKNIMRDFISKVEKSTKCLHGDFQMSNVITSPSGDYFIDLGRFCYGNELYDIGFWYLFSHYNHRGVMAEHFFHMPYDKLIECWDVFFKYYYSIEDKKEKETLEEKIKPFAMISIFPFCINENRDDFVIGIKNYLFEDAFKNYL